MDVWMNDLEKVLYFRKSFNLCGVFSFLSLDIYKVCNIFSRGYNSQVLNDNNNLLYDNREHIPSTIHKIDVINYDL